MSNICQYSICNITLEVSVRKSGQDKMLLRKVLSIWRKDWGRHVPAQHRVKKGSGKGPQTKSLLQDLCGVSSHLKLDLSESIQHTWHLTLDRLCFLPPVPHPVWYEKAVSAMMGYVWTSGATCGRSNSTYAKQIE